MASIRKAILAGAACAAVAAPALAEPGWWGRAGYGYETYSRSYPGYDSDALLGPARSAYPAPGQAYPWARGYGFRGYDQAVYAAYGQAPYVAGSDGAELPGAPLPLAGGPQPGFRGYDQAVYAAYGESRYVADGPPELAGPPPPPACPGAHGGRVIHCEYAPYPR